MREFCFSWEQANVTGNNTKTGLQRKPSQKKNNPCQDDDLHVSSPSCHWLLNLYKIAFLKPSAFGHPALTHSSSFYFISSNVLMFILIVFTVSLHLCFFIKLLHQDKLLVHENPLYLAIKVILIIFILIWLNSSPLVCHFILGFVQYKLLYIMCRESIVDACCCGNKEDSKVVYTINVYYFPALCGAELYITASIVIFIMEHFRAPGFSLCLVTYSQNLTFHSLKNILLKNIKYRPFISF